MTNSDIPLNLTQFDLDSYEFALDELGFSDTKAFEISVQVAKEENSEFIRLDDLNLSGGDNEI